MAAKGELPHQVKKAREREERWQLLQHIVSVTRGPMTVLSFLWVALIIINFVSGLPLFLQWLSLVIWGIFILDFIIEVIVAPHKMTYIKVHWLTVISLLLPAFSVLRILQAIRLVQTLTATGSFSLLRVITASNRGMMAVRRVVGRSKVGYVATLTLLITLAGAAGMYSFESPAALRAAGLESAVHSGAGLHNYGEAVWWTAMVMTTMGSAYWPLTLPGRILCWLLAIYAFGVFGYITATIASYFIGDASESNAAEASSDTEGLQGEVAALREQITALVARLDGEPAD